MPDAIAIIGGACIALGVLLASVPAGLVVLGALLILGAWRLS